MSKSINKLIDEQVKRWELEKKVAKPIDQKIETITISREAGSRGQEVAKLLCKDIGFDLFHNEIIDAMVETSKSSRVLLETLDEKAMNVVDDVVSDIVNKYHLWPDEYSKLLMKILTTVSEHGNAVILGRGANCVLKGPQVLRVRIVAPAAVRREYFQHTMDLNADDAQKHMTSTDANRSAFVRRYFNCDTTDASNYDLVLNTGTLSVEHAVRVIKCAIG